MYIIPLSILIHSIDSKYYYIYIYILISNNFPTHSKKHFQNLIVFLYRKTKVIDVFTHANMIEIHKINQNRSLGIKEMNFYIKRETEKLKMKLLIIINTWEDKKGKQWKCN